jgi:Matrixin
MSSRTRPRLLILLLVFGLVARGTPLSAYLKIGTPVDGTTMSLHWVTTPVRYFVNEEGVPGVDASQLRDALGRSFRTWQDVRTASVSFEFAGFTERTPSDQDGTSTMGFLAQPELERTLAATNYLVDARTGEILESDIFFNAAFPWSVAEGGEPDRYDLQSIATHEAGHVLGLGHSALGETEVESGGARRLLAAAAVMFPIAYSAGDISSRTLQPDDIAGVSDIYPDDAFRDRTGTLQGSVTRNGTGVFGAHIAAFNLATGELIAGFSLDSAGRFVVAGLAPGQYVVRAEPLDDGDVVSFFADGVDVETDFRATYYPQLVTIRAGSGSADVKIAAVPK